MRSFTRVDSREDQSELFTALGNHRRRYTLYACQRANGKTDLSDVAEQVAAWEYGKEVDELTSSERKRVYTSLQQHHLSKLEDANLVEVENGHISLTPRAESLDLYLDVVTRNNIPWSLYYLGLSVISGFVLVLAWVDLLPDQLPVLALAAIIVVVFGVSAAVHHVQLRGTKFGTADRPPELAE